LATITQERAERIARAHACPNCSEYNYKKMKVKHASDAHRKEFDEAWHVVATCGVCAAEIEMGIDDEGDVIYAA
jgi:transcription elongation factor Elf1